MANPGYPQGPQGQSPFPPAQPAPGAPVAVGPGGDSTTKVKPRRRGTSKAVPVVLSMALAGGTFTGLTLGVGTGKSSAATTSDDDSSDKGTDEATKPDKPDGSGSASAEASGSGSASDGSGSGSASSSAWGWFSVDLRTFRADQVRARWCRCPGSGRNDHSRRRRHGRHQPAS